MEQRVDDGADQRPFLKLATGGRYLAALREPPYSLLVSLLLVAAVTAGLAVVDRVFALTHVSIVYVIPVVIAATQLGVFPAIVAAVAGVAASALFFYPPIYSFHITDPQQLIDLPLFIFVAIVTGHLASRVRRQAGLARARESGMRDLYAFSRKLARAHAAKDIHAAIQEHLASIIEREVALFETSPEARGRTEGNADLPETVRSAMSELARKPGDSPGRTIFDRDTNCTWLVRTMSHRTNEFGPVAINLGPGDRPAIDALRAHVDAIWTDVMATLERLDLGHAISEAKMRADTDLLRDALIGSVSHELKTPLSSILGAATVLRQAPPVRDDARLESLANLVCEEAERLNTDIQNLLDASRISSEGIRPHLEWVDPADIVNAALERQKRRLAGHKIVVEVGGDSPLLYVDPVMVEQALGQIINNAATYSDAGSTIAITARSEGTALVVSVADEGFGLTTHEQQHLWERFFRGRQASLVTGSGLGLWIAQAFVKANHGDISASSPGAGGGTVVSIRLPISVRETAAVGIGAHG
jgi:two-component system sensor histidine kinase KdpD